MVKAAKYVKGDDFVFRVAAVGLAVVIALCAAAFGSYVAATRWVNHTLEVGREVDAWLLALLDAQVAERGYILSEDREFLKPYRDAVARERAAAARVRRLVTDNAGQLRTVEEADRNALAAVRGLDEIVSLVATLHGSDAVLGVKSGRTNGLIEAFREDWSRLRAEEERLLAERRSMAQSRAALTLSAALALALASMGLLVFSWRSQRRRAEFLDELERSSRRRLRALSEVAVALSGARTRSQVAAVVLEQGMRAAEADTATLHLLDERGETLELIGHRGVARVVVERIVRIEDDAALPSAFATLKSGEPLWVEGADDYRAALPELADIEAEAPRAQAFWSVPLIVEARPVGLVGMGFYAPRRFSKEDRTLVDTLSKQCGQALVRVLRLEREDEVRRWLATTLRSIGEAVIATDREGLVTFMNPIAEKLTEFTEQEARGRPLGEVFVVFAEDGHVPVESPVARVLRDGDVLGRTNHIALRSRSGREIPIEDSGAPIRNDAGDAFGVVLVFRDVTREKAERAHRDFLATAGEALVASLDYQVTLLTIAELAVPTIADWCVIDVLEPSGRAPRQAAMAHVDPGKLALARKLAERYPRDPNARTGASEVIRSGNSELYPHVPASMIEAAARDAEHLRLLRQLELESALVVPLRARGRTLGAITFAYAESRRRYTDEDRIIAEEFARRAAIAVENALALQAVERAREVEGRLRTEAELANRAKDDFLAVVSHELRTPLSSILGWAVTLRRRGVPEEVERALAVIERNARTQAKLIDDVLDVSRIASGKLSLTLATTNVVDAIAAAIQTATPTAEAKNIVFSTDVPDGGLTILADADRVQQIVSNLLSNAVKFTPKGGSVLVEANGEGSRVRIAVEDTGEGIAPEALPRIFEAFQQADTSITRRHGGLGLGLAIVKQLVAAHGGSIEVTSPGLGSGARFTVWLPLRAVGAAGDRVVRARLTPRPQSYVTAPRLEGVNLLLVDDDEDALGLVAEVLRGHGARVDAVGSAREALDKLQIGRPDVLVSDLSMPHEDGYSLIRHVRALPVTRGGRTPAMALSAYARSEDARRAFAAGFQMHLAKPVEPEQLVTMVANLAGLSSER